MSMKQHLERNTRFLVKFGEAVLGLKNWDRLKVVFWDEAKRTLSSAKEFRATLKSK